ncbi:hypothetical protein [Bacillus clarus]
MNGVKYYFDVNGYMK